MRFPAFACAALSAGSVHAASISIESANPDKPALVVVQGSFDANDGEQFFTKTRSLTAAMVRLQSNGGGLVAGIQIGETIRLKGFQTLVPAGARCASACAMAWLGGTQRFMGPGAQIGLHSAHNAKSEPTPYSVPILIALGYPIPPSSTSRKLHRNPSPGWALPMPNGSASR